MSRSATIGLFLVLATGAPLSAAGPIPEGFTIGRWIVAPYASTSYQLADNIFRDAPLADQVADPDIPPGEEQAPVSDQITTLTAGVEAKLPVRNSLIEVGFEASRYSYAKTDFPRDLTQELWADVAFNFSTGDTLTLSPQYNRGFRDVEQIDAGGEFVFNGVPYNQRRLGVEWARDVSKRQGYSIGVTRVDQIFERPDEITASDPVRAFFNYRGFQSDFEFKQPLPSGRWFTVAYGSRRLNHYEPEDPVGVPFRKEVSDTLYLGFRGYSGKKQPYFFLIGRERFRYENRSARPFQGIVGSAGWELMVGSRTKLDMRLTRRPLPSNSNTYYVINEIRFKLDRAWLKTSHVGLDLVHSRNRYGDTILLDNGLPDCAGQIREDQRSQLGAYAEWRWYSWFGMRLDASHSRRRSNCLGSEYRANTVTASLELGW